MNTKRESYNSTWKSQATLHWGREDNWTRDSVRHITPRRLSHMCFKEEPWTKLVVNLNWGRQKDSTKTSLIAYLHISMCNSRLKGIVQWTRWLHPLYMELPPGLEWSWWWQLDTPTLPHPTGAPWKALFFSCARAQNLWIETIEKALQRFLRWPSG